MPQSSVPQTHPPGIEWLPWWLPTADRSPDVWKRVEIWRRGWTDTLIIRPRHMPQEASVYGLWWRPIQRPKLEPEVAGALHA